MDQKFVFLNGRLLPQEEAKIGLNELGLLRAWAVFDYLRTYSGLPFKFEEHWQRLVGSARATQLYLMYKEEEIREILDEMLYLRADKSQEMGFRMVLSGGYTPDGGSAGTPNFFILGEDLPRIPPEYYRQGLKLMSYAYVRPLAEIKTTHYLPVYMMRPQMNEVGAQDLLFVHDQKVSECTRSNFFLIRENTLITPNTDILKGITRQLVLDLAQDMMSVEERPLSPEEISQADEAFKTGTSTEIIPVVQVDSTRIGKGTPGPKTQRLQEILKQYIQEQIRSSSH